MAYHATVLRQLLQSVPGKRFSLDGSLIDLSMKVFPWADIAPKKAAFKLHLGLDHDGLIPAFAEVSGGLEMDVADSFAVENRIRPIPRCLWG
jgi:hypothetical protein